MAAGIGSAWREIHEYLPILTGRVFIGTEEWGMCCLCGELSDAWQTGSGTWTVGVERGLRLGRAGMSVVGWVFGVGLDGGEKLGSSWGRSRSVWWFGWDGLGMLGRAMVVTGSGVLWRGRLDGRDARGDLVKLC